MQYSAHIQSTINMLDIFFQSLSPFDIITAKYFKNNKWIGSKDRRIIAEFSYAIFRNYEIIKFYTACITEQLGRFYVMTFLKIVKNMSIEKISETFSGKMYAPQRLTDFERHFLKSLDSKNNIPENAILNYPQWITHYLQRAFPIANANQLKHEMLALNEKASLDLRVNTLKSNRAEVKSILALSGFKFEDSRYSANGIRIIEGRIGRNHDIISSGLAEIQDEGSQLVAEICNAKPTDTIIDFCAGAGGKTLAIAASMNNKGRIFALDKHVGRLENAKLRFRRANVNNVYCQEITSKWIKRHYECADIVLVDAPCSGTGTWRRNPDMRARFTQQDLEELTQVQAEILMSAKDLVKPGGRLVYATCSILREENENQISKFIEICPEFVITTCVINDYASSSNKIVNLITNEGFLRLSPAKNGTDGFFAACLTKKTSEQGMQTMESFVVD